MISIAVVLLLLDVLLLLFLAQGAQLPTPMEIEVAPQPWWNSPPFSVSWNGRRFPQEHDVWPWWRPGT